MQCFGRVTWRSRNAREDELAASGKSEEKIVPVGQYIAKLMRFSLDDLLLNL
jgi:hypothetical protein